MIHHDESASKNPFLRSKLNRCPGSIRWTGIIPFQQRKARPPRMRYFLRQTKSCRNRNKPEEKPDLRVWNMKHLEMASGYLHAAKVNTPVIAVGTSPLKTQLPHCLWILKTHSIWRFPDYRYPEIIHSNGSVPYKHL